MGADVNNHKRSKVRDPRWLRVERCRDYYMGKCHRSEKECRFAHPDSNCVVENNKVTVCYDSMRGKCNREQCKFYHPPLHIREYLIAFGKALEQERNEKEQADTVEDSDASSICAFSECSRSSASLNNYEKPWHAENQLDHFSPMVGPIRPRFIGNFPQASFVSSTEMQPAYAHATNVYQGVRYVSQYTVPESCAFLRPGIIASPSPSIPLLDQHAQSYQRSSIVYQIPYQTVQTHGFPCVNVAYQFVPGIQQIPVYYPQSIPQLHFETCSSPTSTSRMYP